MYNSWFWVMQTCFLIYQEVSVACKKKLSCSLFVFLSFGLFLKEKVAEQLKRAAESDSIG